MKIIDHISRILGRKNAQVNADIEETNADMLSPAEIRLLTGAGELDRLRLFASSSRICAFDTNGDTPLHLAARLGNLALCDLLVQSGADRSAYNNEQQTPADLAKIEGHSLVAQLLSLLLQEANTTVKEPRTLAASGSPDAPFTSEQHFEEGYFSEFAKSEVENVDQFLTFTPEEDPESFLHYSDVHSITGSFKPVRPLIAKLAEAEDADWEVDLAPAKISGEAIGSVALSAETPAGNQDFLKLARGGKKSTKRAKVRDNTFLSIDPEFCLDWVIDTFQCKKNIILRSFCTDDDLRYLIKNCKGDVKAEELRTNLLRILEVAGCVLLPTKTRHDRTGWNVKSDIDLNDLQESIEAALTRSTRLPGTELFDVSRADEEALLEPMIRAKQDLLLNIMKSQTALGLIISAVEKMREGLRDAESVTLRSIFSIRAEHPETDEFFQNAEILKEWIAAGSVMDGKPRREALNALDALDLTLTFMREMASVLGLDASAKGGGALIDNLITVHEVATQKLIMSHLPYVRRFSSRNVEGDEDPEDVFQVAFIGLQSSTRRFDPERGVRFMIYSAFWMRQAISRWRADEGAQIRVPAHRFDKLAKIDAAIDKLDIRSDRSVSDRELADEADVTLAEARLLREIPRMIVSPECEDWENIFPAQEIELHIITLETQRVVSDLLKELDDRQADIIKMRFGIGHDREMTLEEIGQIYGLTRERIRQIEAKALLYLSHPARKYSLKTLLGL
jgi:RNA polymerase primary sigma factor